VEESAVPSGPQEEIETEDVSETTEPDPTASTALAAPATSQQQRRGKRKLSAEQQAMAPIAEYFKLKAARKQETTSAAESPAQKTEDQLFAEMLVAEMKTIKSASVKRKLKRQLLDTVCAAQEEDEVMSGSAPLVNLVMQYPPAAATATATASSEDTTDSSWLVQYPQTSPTATMSSQEEALQTAHMLLQMGCYEEPAAEQHKQ